MAISIAKPSLDAMKRVKSCPTTIVEGAEEENGLPFRATEFGQIPNDVLVFCIIPYAMGDVETAIGILGTCQELRALFNHHVFNNCECEKDCEYTEYRRMIIPHKYFEEGNYPSCMAIRYVFNNPKFYCKSSRKKFVDFPMTSEKGYQLTEIDSAICIYDLYDMLEEHRGLKRIDFTYNKILNFFHGLSNSRNDFDKKCITTFTLEKLKSCEINDRHFKKVALYLYFIKPIFKRTSSTIVVNLIIHALFKTKKPYELKHLSFSRRKIYKNHFNGALKAKLLTIAAISAYLREKTKSKRDVVISIFTSIIKNPFNQEIRKEKYNLIEAVKTTIASILEKKVFIKRDTPCLITLLSYMESETIDGITIELINETKHLFLKFIEKNCSQERDYYVPYNREYQTSYDGEFIEDTKHKYKPIPQEKSDQKEEDLLLEESIIIKEESLEPQPQPQPQPQTQLEENRQPETAQILEGLSSRGSTKTKRRRQRKKRNVKTKDLFPELGKFDGISSREYSNRQNTQSVTSIKPLDKIKSAIDWLINGDK